MNDSVAAKQRIKDILKTNIDFVMSSVPEPMIDVNDPEVVAATNASPPSMAIPPITNKRNAHK